MTNKNVNESKLKQIIRNYLSNAELKETPFYGCQGEK